MVEQDQGYDQQECLDRLLELRKAAGAQVVGIQVGVELKHAKQNLHTVRDRPPDEPGSEHNPPGA